MPHNYHRRCLGHDYHGRCIYMVTFMKAFGLPAFSEIKPEPGAAKITPVVNMLPLGKIIYSGLDKLEHDFPQVKILCRIAMPDHLHFLIFVTERMDRPLGSVLATFTSRCTKTMRSILANPNFLTETGNRTVRNYWRRAFYDFQKNPKLSVFTPGFNDKIVFSRTSRESFYNYICDNPRRYLVKKHLPEYFRNKLNLELDGKKLALYGNFFLLDNPVRSAVKISRRKETMPDLSQKIQQWQETIRCGGVLVSPFINPEEKVYRDLAIVEGASVILIVNYIFSERTKPHKTLFDLCGKGRILFVSTGNHDLDPNAVTRAEALEMNAIAVAIAALAPGSCRLSRR